MISGIDPDSIVYLNGDFVRLGEAKISVLDRGFIYGDGIYDVVPAYRGKPFRMDGHLNRLERSLAKIGIANPFTRVQWEKLVLDMLARSGKGADCMVYIQVTRGVAKRDHAFPKNVAPSVFIMVSPFQRVQAERENGLTAIAIDDVRWLHCDIKSVSLLGNVLAKQQAVQAGVDEVIQFRDGFLTEGASCNIWIVRNGTLLAPMRNNLILEGVRYGLMEELAAQAGIAFQARRISREEVDSADEILMTAATKEVLPIVVFNGRPVADGRPGPVFAQLRAGYDKAIQATEQA